MLTALPIPCVDVAPPRVFAIWCQRVPQRDHAIKRGGADNRYGGYGSKHVESPLKWVVREDPQKVYCKFINLGWGWPAIHRPSTCRTPRRFATLESQNPHLYQSKLTNFGSVWQYRWKTQDPTLSIWMSELHWNMLIVLTWLDIQTSTLRCAGLQQHSCECRLNRSMATQNSYGLGMTPVNEYITTKCLIFGRVVRCSKDMGYTGAPQKNY